MPKEKHPCDEIRPSYTFDVSCQGTVPQALEAFFESTDFESCIRLGVSLGGDSDTLCCIAGGIAEAFYKDIPTWIVGEVWKRLPYEFEEILIKLNKNSHYREITYIPQASSKQKLEESRDCRRESKSTVIGNVINKAFGGGRKPILSSGDIERFVQAQAEKHTGYNVALAEIRDGHQETHWIWYVFPQLRGLGRSAYSDYYGIKGIPEAETYLSHKVLGARLREISAALLLHKGKAITAIVFPENAKKIRSCMTLFDAVSPNDVFQEVLDAFYDGERDGFTEMMLGR